MSAIEFPDFLCRKKSPEDVAPGKTQYFAWYDNHSDPTGNPFWEGSGWYAAKSPEEALEIAKADGCLWTEVAITKDTCGYPKDEYILVRG